MLTESRFNKFFLSYTKIGVALCLMMCFSMIAHAQSNSITDQQQKIAVAKSYLNFAQGATCAEMEPFCTAIGASFPASINTQAEAGNQYGCLFVQPNPEWYYLQIEDPGYLEITLTNSNNVDIDFIMYGPYPDLQAAQSRCGLFQTEISSCPFALNTCPSGVPCDTLNGCVGGDGVDCSYDPQSTEVADIPNAQTGEVYVFLITNFSNQPTEIFLTKTGGMASTDCSILAPTITCPQDMEVTCFSEIMADTDAVEFTINCGTEGVLTASSPIGNINNSACGESAGDEYRITYTVTDECGNVATCVQLFTMSGNEGPQLTCPVNITLVCGDALPAPETTLPGTDDCDLATEFTVIDVTDSDYPADFCEISDVITVVRRYTVADACGNESICTYFFQFEPDLEGPQIACLPDVVLTCGDELPTPETTLPGTDNCDPATEFAVTGVAENDPPVSFCEGNVFEVTRVYTVEDVCGNKTFCTQLFTFETDSTPPTVTCPPNPATTFACSDPIPAPDVSLVVATDNCTPAAGIVITHVGDSPNIDSIALCPGNDSDYLIVRTYRATDACGNSSTCTQRFIISADEEPPVITCPVDVTGLVCGDTLPVAETTLSGTDNCDTATEFAVTNVVDSALPTSFCSGDNLTATRTYTVEDNCGNEAQCIQTFTFLPVEVPTISCPADTTVSCFEDISVDISDVSFTTSCGLGATVSIGSVIPNGTFNCPGSTYIYSYTVEDDCGGTATCNRVFTIANDAPTISCPADTTVSCFEDISVDISDVSFTTSCGLGATVSIGSVIPNGTFNCPGSTYIYPYTVEDDCGRTATCNRVFTIANDAPTITCPPDMEVTCPSEIMTDIDAVQYTISCGTAANVTVSSPVINGTIGTCPGTTYTYTYTVTDDCGRTASCDQVFTINNDPPIIINCPANATVACAADINTEVETTNGFFSTSCGTSVDISVEGPVISGTPDCPGTTYTYTYVVTEACGRIVTCDQVFTIDNVAPTITCPEDCPVACASDIRPGTPTFTTSCFLGGTLSLTGPVVDGDPHCDGTTYTYTHTVTDACGRTVSCDQVFTIVNECHLVDFDYDDEGNPLHPGTDMFDQYEDFTITTDNPHRCVQLFDTGHPTANDYDLGTPNQQYGGPGIGAGGANNTEFQGNALIVSKDCGVPNETEGQLIFTFDCSVTIKTVDLLDMKCGHSEIELYDEHHNLIEELPIPGYGVNSFNTFEVNVSGVYTMIVDLDCGGGVTAFKYCKDNSPGTDCVAPDLCEDYNLDFDNSGYHWSTNSTSGSFDVGNQNYTISIADDDNILEDTYEYGGGLTIGINPHDVHDEVVVCYNLSQISNHVSFDIHDLDRKNYWSSRQQEAVCVYGLLGDDPTQILPTITSLDGHVDVDGNCAEATTDSAHSHDDESVLVEFDECIDKVVIVYGTGSNSPTHNPSYSKITIGKRLGFNSKVCPGECVVVECSSAGPGPGGDDDGDGVCNNEDVCPGGNDNLDRDGDGIPDACDDICYDYNIDHDGCGAAWGHNDTSGSVELGNDNIDISIIDNDNIFVNSQANGAGLQVGINPHNVNDELVVCYNLSKSSSHVVFDITDLDLKSGNSKQQEKVCIFGTLGANQTPILPTVTSLDGHVNIVGNCGEATTNSAYSHDDESILVEFTECIDKITIVYGTGSQSPTSNPSYSKITIGESIFSVEQCKDACNAAPCPVIGTSNGDADNDGVCDGDDVCPGFDDNIDTDGDGIPDGCDGTPKEDEQSNANISLYPNPVYGSGNVTIEIDTEARGDAQVVLVDALGRMVSSENIQLMNDLTIHQFSTKQLAAGVYFVQLQTNEWRTNGLKLVVVKP